MSALVLPSISAAADGVALPGTLGQMTVDGLHSHLVFCDFQHGVVITDFRGNTVASISEPGAAGISLSPDSGSVYVALGSSEGVAAIDTGTLKETARYSTPTHVEPHSVAFAGGRIWFGYDNGTTGTGAVEGLGSINPADGSSTIAFSNPGRANFLASSGAAPGVLVGSFNDNDTVSLKVFDVSTGTAKVTATAAILSSKLAITPDGADVVTDSAGTRRLSDLSADTRYPAIPNQWQPFAVAPDGTLAYSSDGGLGMPPIIATVSPPPSGATLRSYDFNSTTWAIPGNNTTWVGGLAWDPDGSRLFMLDTYGGTRLRTLLAPKSPGSSFVPYGPDRFLDTRSGIGAPKAMVGPGGVVRLQIADVRGIPQTGVTAVTLNLTGTDATEPTWVSAYPDGVTRPTASNLNLVPGQNTPNLVTVPVGPDGIVNLYNHAGNVDLVADVEGYYSSSAPVGASPAGLVQPSAPTRVLDTRYGIGVPKGAVGSMSTVHLQLPAGSFTGASAVALNVTETDATDNSWVGVHPTGVNTMSSALNFTRGQISSNLVTVPIDSTGGIDLFNHSGSVDLIADVQGYVMNKPALTAPTGSPYFPITPTRMLDTRYGLGAPKAPLGAQAATIALKVAGTNGIPAGAKAVLVNLTATDTTADTWLSAYADGTTLPDTSNLNVAAGTTRPVLALVRVGADGSIAIHNNAGTVNVIADIEGYYTG